jgi:hypothetical protein
VLVRLLVCLVKRPRQWLVAYRLLPSTLGNVHKTDSTRSRTCFSDASLLKNSLYYYFSNNICSEEAYLTFSQLLRSVSSLTTPTQANNNKRSCFYRAIVGRSPDSHSVHNSPQSTGCLGCTFTCCQYLQHCALDRCRVYLVHKELLQFQVFGS